MGVSRTVWQNNSDRTTPPTIRSIRTVLKSRMISRGYFQSTHYHTSCFLYESASSIIDTMISMTVDDPIDMKFLF